MTKEEWQQLAVVLTRIHTDFSDAWYDYKNGKNKKIRDPAERKLNSCIQTADRYIRNRAEAFDLLTGENNNDQGRAIFYDEFLQERYFEQELREFLNKIQEKIQSMG